MAMGLFGFGNKKEGGLMDVIRCDEADYLVWKWSPTGEKSRKENAIRYGSSLRVKAGEVAVLVYKQGDKMMDFIEGPFDQTLKTANLPILTSIVGMAYGGDTPFQAEIYFINLAGSVRLPFFMEGLSTNDPQAPNLPIDVKVKGSIIFNITDYKKFISSYRMRTFDMDDLSMQIQDILKGQISECIAKVPKELSIPATHIKQKLNAIRGYIESQLKPVLDEIASVSLKRFDISEINLDENSLGYIAVMSKGLDEAEILHKQYKTAGNSIERQGASRDKDFDERQRIDREETQRLQKLATETAYLGAHQLNIQGDVARTAAESLGMMNANMGFGEGGGMNPAGMMTGMMMGSALGGNMANMMGSMMNGMNQQTPPPPPSAAISQYYIAINGQQSGPYNMAQLQQLAQTGQLTPNTYAWKQGMSGWELAARIPELMSLFGAVPPPMPPVTPVF